MGGDPLVRRGGDPLEYDFGTFGGPFVHCTLFWGGDPPPLKRVGMLEGNFTSRMVNYFEVIKGLHYIIGPAGELITAVGITLHQWPVQGII